MEEDLKINNFIQDLLLTDKDKGEIVYTRPSAY
jgi:hypothetical protein